MDPLLSCALEAAEAAAEIHLRYFGEIGMEGAREKAHSDFVTQVDLEAQEAALGVIRTRFPSHGILAEEDEGPGDGHFPEGGAGAHAARAWPEGGGHLWIVDPLDGTTNYLHGHPQFAASVGVGRRVPTGVRRRVPTGAGSEVPAGAGPEVPEGVGRDGPEGDGTDPVQTVVFEAGAVVAPRTGERWWARRGQGAFKNGRPIRVSSLESIGTALVGTGFPFKEPDLVPRYLQQFQRVLPVSGGIRRAGSAALDLCYLAEGILDGFWEEDYLSPWDVAAGLVILREAGGVATRLNGSEIDLENGSVLAANSRALYGQLGTLVRGP